MAPYIFLLKFCQLWRSIAAKELIFKSDDIQPLLSLTGNHGNHCL